MWLAENTGRKHWPSVHHRTNLSGYIFATKACIDNQKKTLLNQYLFHMPSQYVELQRTNSETSWRVWVPQHISTGFASWRRYCSNVAQRKSTKLCTVFGRLLVWYTIYTFSRAL